MDKVAVIFFLSQLIYHYVTCSVYDFISYQYENRTDPASRQLYEFRKKHPIPIGQMTTSYGHPVEIRDTHTLNTDLLSNSHLLESTLNMDSERIPERFVHAKGAAALGYFEVTNDVSKYTKAEAFNGIGKRTAIVARFSSAFEYTGGNDLAREAKGLGVKFYTREGNLDFLCLHIPVYFYKDPLLFQRFAHMNKRNPKTFLTDRTDDIDFITLRPETLPAYMWIFSDYGVPNGYRKMDFFPIHTYEINNKNGEKYYVKFNFRTEQGLQILTSEEARVVSGRDRDYYNRDLYNAIEEKHYPSWILEMDIISLDDITKINYNPFEINRLWKKGTYHTVQIGRLVLNKNPDNAFRISEQSAFNPANLVPGIPGPVDYIFKIRGLSYLDTQKYRLGVNHNKIEVNRPIYQKVYNRDGVPPVNDNMKDAPNYYPNSFSGPISYVDPARPKERLMVYESNAIDLDEVSYFYNNILGNETQRDRLATNAATIMSQVPPFLQEKFIELLYLADKDLGDRVYIALKKALLACPPPAPIGLNIERQVYLSLNKDYYEEDGEKKVENHVFKESRKN